jgi:hypothetical protein
VDVSAEDPRTSEKYWFSVQRIGHVVKNPTAGIMCITVRKHYEV